MTLGNEARQCKEHGENEAAKREAINCIHSHPVMVRRTPGGPQRG